MEDNKSSTGVTIDLETSGLDGKSKIVVIGHGTQESKTMIESLKKKFGEDIIIVNSVEELKGVELKQDDLSNVKETFVITNHIPLNRYDMPITSGKERRNERRKKERKNKRKY